MSGAMDAFIAGQTIAARRAPIGENQFVTVNETKRSSKENSCGFVDIVSRQSASTAGGGGSVRIFKEILRIGGFPGRCRAVRR